MWCYIRCDIRGGKTNAAARHTPAIKAAAAARVAWPHSSASLTGVNQRSLNADLDSVGNQLFCVIPDEE